MPSEAAPVLWTLCRPQRAAGSASWARYVFAILLLLLCATTESMAASETYTGLLIPEARTPPIPIVVDLEQARSRISGHVTTSPPLTGKGRIITGERQRSVCNFKSELGAGRNLVFEGYCLSRTIEGTYTITFPDGSSRTGTYRLLRADPDKAAGSKPVEPGDQPIRSATICLSANSACLAACPRGDYNAEFVCSNRCRQRLAACRAKATTAAGAASAPPTSPQN